MATTILRMNHFMKEADFNAYKTKWEQENPDTLVIPITMSVERTKGKWIYKKDENWRGGGLYYCSICKYGFSDYYDIELFDYCPHCGAEMKAEETNEKDHV